MGSRALDILIALADRPGEVVSHRELTERVWRGVVVSPGALRVHVAGLRKALGGGEFEFVANVPGQGYSLVAPIREVKPDVSEAAESRLPDVAQPAATPPHNLPNQLTSFIGREREIRTLRELLGANRLFTLTGIGGCGKTRLALQLAADVLSAFPDGCWLVELAPLADAALVAQTVANVLGIKTQGDTSLEETVAEHLRGRRALLVLDNAEHLIEQCATLADMLLGQCPELKILVTSREPLRVGGELTHRVPSLTVPDEDAGTSEVVLACEAARLFVERARLHRPDFELASTSAGALASICRRLDGIAMAIELAAPRIRTMSIEELNAHLDDRFGILTGWHRTALPRHRTLRSLIDWSHDLLRTDEKTVLRRAAVFAGGMTVEAAECVCAGGDVGRRDVLDILTSLTDKSILVAETQEAGTRFGMLETLRDYALGRLRESGEEPDLRLRHCEYFIALADHLEGSQDDEQRQAMLGRMDMEQGNVRAALAWCEATPARSVMGLRLAGKLDQFWQLRGHFAEGIGWIDRLLDVASAGEPTEDHGIAHHTAGLLAYREADNVAAEEHLRAALAIFQRLGLRQRMARALGNLGNLAKRGALRVGDDLRTARDFYSQGLAIARELGDRRSTMKGLHCLGLVARDLGDDTAAQSLFEEGIAVAREMGDWSPAALLAELGLVRQHQGELLQARDLFMEALAAKRRFGDKDGLAEALTCLGDVSRELGDLAAARAHLGEALTIERQMNDQREMSTTLEAFACLGTEVVGSLCGARLFGRVQRLREELAGSELTFSFERQRLDRRVAHARAKLHDDAAFDQAWNEGRSMTLAAAVEYAMNV